MSRFSNLVVIVGWHQEFALLGFRGSSSHKYPNSLSKYYFSIPRRGTLWKVQQPQGSCGGNKYPWSLSRPHRSHSCAAEVIICLFLSRLLIGLGWKCLSFSNKEPFATQANGSSPVCLQAAASAAATAAVACPINDDNMPRHALRLFLCNLVLGVKNVPRNYGIMVKRKRGKNGDVLNCQSVLFYQNIIKHFRNWERTHSLS